MSIDKERGSQEVYLLLPFLFKKNGYICKERRSCNNRQMLTRIGAWCRHFNKKNPRFGKGKKSQAGVTTSGRYASYSLNTAAHLSLAFVLRFLERLALLNRLFESESNLISHRCGDLLKKFWFPTPTASHSVNTYPFILLPSVSWSYGGNWVCWKL